MIRKLIEGQAKQHGLLIITLIGFALRLYTLGDANVWWDEAYSVWLARMPLADALRITAADVHPPLYYALLHGWIRLAGDGEFAIRFLSALIGTLSVALVYPLGARLLDRRWAALGSLLLAISVLHIWWSQETRMYILAAGLGTLSFYLLVRLMREPRSIRLWIAYVLAVVAALHTLYLASLVILAAGLAVFVIWLARRVALNFVLQWIAAQIAVVALVLPWALYALPLVRSQAAGAEFAPGTLLTLYMLLLSTGISTGVESYLPIAIGYGGLILAALVALARQRRWDAVALLLPAVLIPPLVIYLLMLVRWRFYAPAPEARYFLLFAPIAALIPAAGIGLLMRWRKWAGAALALSVVGLALWALPPRFADRYLRDQWKTAVRVIGAYAAPDDTVVLVSGDRYPLFLYEYERLPADRPAVQLVPDGVPMLTPNTVDDQMQRATKGARRVWLVEIETGVQDPNGLARSWMDAHSRPALSIDLDYNRLTLYTPDGEPPALAVTHPPPQVSFHEGAVQGIDLPVREFRPGDTIHLGLYTGQNVTVRVDHSSGLVLAESMAAAEGPTRIDVPFAITQATPAGEYALMSGSQRLATVEITHSDPLWREQDVPMQLNAYLGGSVELIGFDMTPRRPRPGDSLSIDLFWRARTPLAADYTVFVQIVGPFNSASGNPLWGQHDGPPVQGTFPTRVWPAGLIVRDRHVLTVDPAAPPAEYQVLTGLYDPLTGVRMSIPGNADNAASLLNVSIP